MLSINPILHNIKGALGSMVVRICNPVSERLMMNGKSTMDNAERRSVKTTTSTQQTMKGHHCSGKGSFEMLETLLS